MGIRYQVDMDKPTQATRLSTRLYQGDEEANRITLELVRGGKQANVGTLTVTGEMERADGARVPCEGSQNGSTVSIVLNEHCYYVPGPCVIYLKASAGGVLRTMLELHGQVVQKSNGPMVDVNEELVDVDAVIQLYGEMRTAKEEAERATAAADEAATDAANAATRANDAAQSIEGLTVSASPGAAADVEITEEDGVKHIHFVLKTGTTPDITFEAATGEPGTQVQVQQSGTPEAPHVKLTIPRGDTGAVEGIDYYAGEPSALGTASPGTANGVAHGDHVHPMPTAEQVGARPENWLPTAAEVGAMAMELVWQNASPGSEYPPTSENMSSADGNYVMIEYRTSINASQYCAALYRKQEGGILSFCSGSASKSFSREFTVEGNKIYFGEAYANGAESNWYCVPIRIWVVKGVPVL